MKISIVETSTFWLLAAIPSSFAFNEAKALPCNLGPPGCFPTFGAATRRPKHVFIPPNLCLLASPRSDAEFSDLGVALLNESTRDLLAEEVLSLLNVPFVPGPIVKFVVNWVIKAMSSDLSPETMVRLNALLEAETTSSESDDASWDDRNAVADDIADELSAKLDVPILSEEQEIETLRSTVRTALAVLTTSDNEFRDARVTFSLNAAQDLLGGAEGRRKLADVLNAQVDVPFLGEAQEQDLLVTLLGNCADALQSLLPQELVVRLKGEGTEGLKEIKDYLISRIDDRVQLGIMVPKEKKLWVIEKVVDSVIDIIVGDTEMEFFLMDAEERRTKLLEMRESLEYEVEMSKQAFEKQQEAMKDQIDRINQRLGELEK